MARPMSPQAAGRRGGLATSSRHDPLVYSAPGRKKAASNFHERVVEAAAANGETLSDREVARRVEVAKRLHMTQLADARWRKHKEAKGAA
jgi:hypothetical protein